MENKEYSEEEVRLLKRYLLGLCGKKTTKSYKELVDVVLKTGLENCLSEAEKAIKRIVTLSENEELIYKRKYDTLFFEPEYAYIYSLNISGNEENKNYDIFLSVERKYCSWSEM